MAYTTVNKSTDHFNTKTYTGTGSSNALTGVGFQPDFTWIKVRSETNNHELYDAVRGVTKRIYSDQTSAEDTNTAGLTAFGSDGFTVNTGHGVNKSSATYVSWNWKAGTGQGSSNTDGSINTTYTSVNTTAGFSISQYTGAGSTSTVGHGLGVAPKVMIIKCTSNGSTPWEFYHESIGNNKKVNLNSTAAEASSGYMNNTSPTSSVFTVVNDADIGGSGRTYIAYCFAEKKGFSKFGSYTGNGNADGTFIYTGFKPAWFMWKRSSSTGGWYISDAKRDTFNEVDVVLSANDTGTESDQGTTFDHDFLSNGIKIKNSVAAANSSGETFIFMAFAEAPLVGSNNIPATAR
jgi:hypothetical protein